MDKETIGDKIIDFNLHLDYDGPLPPGFQVINPFRDNPLAVDVMKTFYHKFYGDHFKRSFIIGINPSRHGAAVTGIPFTDTKRLASACGILMPSAHTHEISSVFMYKVIAAYGGAQAFYRDFYINSPFPLAIVRQQGNAWLNANYYDDPNLFDCLRPFMIKCLKRHINLGLHTKEVYVLGKKNAQFLQKLNKEAGLFDLTIILDHPRYIQQYKSKDAGLYIDGYLQAISAHFENQKDK